MNNITRLNLTPSCWTYEQVMTTFPTRIDSLAARCAFGLVFGCVMVVGLAGNLGVIYCSATKTVGFDLRKAFVVSLSGADLLICAVALPTTVVTDFIRKWVFGAVLCHSVAFLQATSVFYSSFTFMAIALDRYLLVVYPDMQACSIKLVSVSVASLLIASIALAAPFLFTMSHVRNEQLFCYPLCMEVWADPRKKRVYSAVSFSLQFILPIVVTCACYGAIICKVRRQLALRKRHEILLENAKARIRSRKKRTMAMSLLMVGSFVVFWLPLNLYNMTSDWNLVTTDQDWQSFVKLLCYAVGMCSTVSNPIIYSWFHEPFRRKVLCRFCPKCYLVKMGCGEQQTTRGVSEKPAKVEV